MVKEIIIKRIDGKERNESSFEQEVVGAGHSV